jgi:hypothetical protein
MPKDAAYIYDGVNIITVRTGNVTKNVPVEGTIILDKPFEELPLRARYVITYRALLQVYSIEYGADANVSLANSILAEHYTELTAQHLKQVKVNSSRTNNLGRYLQYLRG